MPRVLTPRNKFTRDLASLPRLPAYELSRRVCVKYDVPRGSFRFNTGDLKYCPQHLYFDAKRSRGVLYQDRTQRSTSDRVFRDSTILPYLLIGRPSTYQPELDFLAPIIAPTVPRVPCVYRISDTWIIDDLGRLYRDGPDGYTWYQYRLSRDLRTNITLTNSDGTKLTRPCYVFSGLAGYLPGIQHHFAFSLKYDFHHVSENKLDVRPDGIVALETDLHRYVHSNDLRDEVGEFFKQSKNW